MDPLSVNVGAGAVEVVEPNIIAAVDDHTMTAGNGVDPGNLFIVDPVTFATEGDDALVEVAWLF